MPGLGDMEEVRKDMTADFTTPPSTEVPYYISEGFPKKAKSSKKRKSKPNKSVKVKENKHETNFPLDSRRSSSTSQDSDPLVGNGCCEYKRRDSGVVSYYANFIAGLFQCSVTPSSLSRPKSMSY